MVLVALCDAPVVVSLGGTHFGGGRTNMDLAELCWCISGRYLTDTWRCWYTGGLREDGYVLKRKEDARVVAI